jgi:hypothetical protein
MQKPDLLPRVSGTLCAFIKGSSALKNVTEQHSHIADCLRRLQSILSYLHLNAMNCSTMLVHTYSTAIVIPQMPTAQTQQTDFENDKNMG